MTEKRFTLGVCERGLGLIDNKTKEQYLENDDVHLILLCEVLNELDNENQSLKQELDNFYLLIGKGDWNGIVNLLKRSKK